MSLALAYTVSSKVETLKLEGEVLFVFHGSLHLEESENPPLQLALPVPEEVWRNTNVGETLRFECTDFQDGKIVPFAPNAV